MGGSAAKKGSVSQADKAPLSDSTPQKEAPSGRKTPNTDPEFRAQLIIDHREHGIRLAWSLLNRWRIRIEQDDVVSVVGAALVEAANRFDDTRGVSFRTFFFYHLRGMLIKEVTQLIDDRKSFRSIPQENVEQIVATTDVPEYWPLQLVERENPEMILEKRQFEEVFWKTCGELDALEKEVLVRHFVQDEALKDIASDLDYCRCHISRVKSRALARLKKSLPAALEEETEEASSAVNKKRYTGGRGRRKALVPSQKKRFQKSLAS